MPHMQNSWIKQYCRPDYSVVSVFDITATKMSRLIKENIETTETDWNSIMGNENYNREDENFGAHGYQQQEVKGDEFVSISDSDADDDYDDDFDDSFDDSYDDSDE